MRLGMVSTYPPRRCGPAAFAAELGRALAPEFDPVVCAIDRYGLTYPREVAAVIKEDERDDYQRAARVMAEHGVDVVLIHDDGSGGGYLPDLVHELDRLGLPYVVLLHRMPGPDAAARRGAAMVVAGAWRVLVFTEAARERVPAVLAIARDLVEVIPFGVPTVLWHSRRPAGRRGMRERAATPRPALTDLLDRVPPGPLLASVGGADRGLELVLDALPEIRRNRADVQVVVVSAGADARRELLERRGMTGSVHVLDAYLSPVELSTLFARTDVVLAPSLPADRAWSATMTAAVTAGCAVVAGTHPYAEELLSGGVGVTAAPGGLARAVLTLLASPDRLAGHRAAALARGGRLTWPAVTNRYAAILRGVARSGAQTSLVPQIRLDGVTTPAPGESEQWARLAVVATGLVRLPPEHLAPRLWRRALSWLDTSITELAGGAAAGATGWSLWGLGTVAAEPGVPLPLRERAAQLRTMVAALTLPGLDAQAYAVIGLAADPPADGVRLAALRTALDRLDQAWTTGRRGSSWPWFSERLDRGAGARLPQALITAGRQCGNGGLLGRGLESLEWYARRCGLGGGVLRLPGSGAELAADAGALVEALVDAYLATRNVQYARLALTAFEWFHGGNRYGAAVYDPDRGTADAVLRPGDDIVHRADGTLPYLGALLRLAGAGLVRLVGTPSPDLAAA